MPRARCQSTGRLCLHAPPVASCEPWCSRLALAGVVIFAVASLVTIFALHRIGDYYTETDFYGGYVVGARLIQHGRLVVSRYGVVGPVFEMVLALVGFVVRDLYVAAQLIAASAAVGIVLLWFLLLRRLADARLGLWTMLFLATNATLFRYGTSATTDTLAVALQAVALWTLFARGGLGASVVAGCVAALAFLTRYSGLYLLPAGVLLVAAGAAGSERRRDRVAGFVVGWALPVLAWGVYAIVQGDGLTFQLHHGIAYEMYARPAGVSWDEYQRRMHPQFRSLWDVLTRDPAGIASRLVSNVRDHLARDGQDLLGWTVALCAVLGVVSSLMDRGWRRLWPVGVVGGLAFLNLLPTFHSPRYSLAVLPAYACAAGWLITSPRCALWVRGPRGLRLKSVLALVLLALALRTLVTAEIGVLGELPTEVLPVARFLRTQAAPGDRVIVRKPHLSYYSGVPGVSFPFADSLADLARFARDNRVRWLYVAWPEAQTRPRLMYLLDPTAVLPGLTPRLVTGRHASVLYEIGPQFGESADWMANDTLVTWHLARSQLLVEPDHADALFAVAMVEASRSHFGAARTHLERLVDRARPSAAPWLLLGEVALRQDDAALAERCFRRVLALEPRSLSAEAGLGYVSLLRGRVDEAVDIWRSIAGADPHPEELCRMVFQATRAPQDVPRTHAALTSARRHRGMGTGERLGP